MSSKKGNAKNKEVVVAPGSYIIKEAHVKDDFCNYVYEITAGVGNGDAHKVSGSGIVKPDMKKTFERLRVHLAAVDDVFKHSNVEIEDIDTMHNHDLTDLYHVTGIKIKGNGDNESVILIGSKYVSCARGRIELSSPKIPMDPTSSYKWYNELATAVADVRREVALYKEGKYDAVEEDEEVENPKQMKITDMIKEEA